MTGYGVAEGPVCGGLLQVEVRTVNHRHFAVSLKLGASLQQLESAVRDRLRNGIERGHVTLTARWIHEPERPTAIRVDMERARETVRALSQLKSELDLPGEVDLAFVARQPDVLTSGAGETPSVDEAELLAVVQGAMEGAVAMREREGSFLSDELLSLLAQIENELSVVQDRAPFRVEAERDRLRRSVAELLDGRTLDEQRLSQEIAIFADKLDITEEMVRLSTHIGACREAIGADGAVGRKLSFLGQEMLREVNTIGSKANDAIITHGVIAMKGLVEKIREQVENLE